MLRSPAGRAALLRAPALLLGMIGLSQAWAQQPAAPAAEPPTVVGRIADLSGTVSHKAAAASEWEKAERNWPLVVGDAVYSAADGQARLEIGGAMVTLRPNAVVDLAALDDRSASLRANSGSASIATAGSGEAISILTPRGGVSLGPDGLYRVSAGDEGTPTEIAVCRGGAVLADGQTRAREGEMVVLGGDLASPQPRIAAAPSGGCDAAPLREVQLPPKVSRRMTGIRDLGERGRWSRAPSGADVWFPADVGEDWAPYRKGRWSWVAPWGWTWVDDAPWGFAPFHYGRWSEIDGRWGWLPGEHAEHPVYAPAMVAFVEAPPDAVVGTDPAFGWVPLAPDEVYRPYYPTPGLDYARRINMNVVGVGAATIAALIAAPLAVAALRNRRAATVVPTSVMTGSRPVAPALLQTRPQVLASAPVRGAGQGLPARGAGAPRIPLASGSRPVAGPPRALPPLPTRPAGGAAPRVPAPTTPPVVAPGRVPTGPAAGRPPVAGVRPADGPAPARPGTGQVRPGAGGRSPGTRPPTSGPVARPLPRTAPTPSGGPPGAQRGPVGAPASRPQAPASRPQAPASRPQGPRPVPPVARPMAAPVARPATAPRPAPVARPAPAARPAAAPRPAPPRANPTQTKRP